MSKTKHDPLEAAKVTDKTQKVDDANLAREDWSPPKPDETALEVMPVAASAPAEPPAKKKLYKLTVGRTLSAGGYTGFFKAGSIFDPGGYGGEAGIQRMIDSGVQLEAFEE